MDDTLAKTLVHVGFRSAIIRIHTGMTRKQVTSLRKREGIVGPSNLAPSLMQRVCSLKGSNPRSKPFHAGLLDYSKIAANNNRR